MTLSILGSFRSPSVLMTYLLFLVTSIVYYFDLVYVWIYISMAQLRRILSIVALYW